MLVTIITDASFCPHTRAGGYGCWIASDRGRGEYGGPLNDTSDSSEAEAKAACNGLHHAITNGLVKQGDRILIQMDCKPALSLFKEERPSRLAERAALEWLKDTAQRNNLTLLFRHVKGHNTNSVASRSIAQEKCDKLARKYMELERGKRNCQALQTQIKQSKRKHVERTPSTKTVDIERKFAQLIRRVTRVDL